MKKHQRGFFLNPFKTTAPISYEWINRGKLDLPTSSSIKAVVCGDTNNWVLMATSANGVSILNSSDGITWSAPVYELTGSAYNYNRLFYANGVFFAGSNTGHYATSTDGTTWTEKTMEDFGHPYWMEGQMHSVLYAHGLWIISGQWGLIATSPDLVTWTRRGTPSMLANLMMATLSSGAHGDGITALNAQWAGQDQLLTTANGVDWTQVPTPTLNPATSMVLKYGNGVWVMACDADRLFTSTDLVTWTQRNLNFISTASVGDALTALHYGKDGLWMVCNDIGRISTSPDATTWTESLTPFSLYDAVFSLINSNGVWVAAAQSRLVGTSQSYCTLGVPT